MASGAAYAQHYPSKAVKIIVPFAAGSATDGLARLIAEELAKAFSNPFIVENKPGASAIIGAQAVARSAADGYTLFITSNTSHSANPSLFKKLPYDPVKDFTPIARIGFLPFILVVNASLPVKSMAEFIAYAKANPGKLSYATSNSTSLVAAETIKAMAKIDMTGVPYKANPQALTDLMGGQVQVMVADLGTSRTHIEAGRLRALGVTPEKRTALMPNLPSISEAGLPGFDLTSWVGLLGPIGMPKQTVAKLHHQLKTTLARRQVQQRMAALGYEAVPSSPEEFRAFIKQQILHWANKVDAAGIQPE